MLPAVAHCMVNCICIKIVFFYCMQSETGYANC
nr:MAG TPA: hypothetical protein [Caudoviricetes sp.]DAX93049.1 MAG TPA: hypothetical protein [Caudoviricetes sp.]